LVALFKVYANEKQTIKTNFLIVADSKQQSFEMSTSDNVDDNQQQQQQQEKKFNPHNAAMMTHHVLLMIEHHYCLTTPLT
jgi:hypothetical protein